MASWNLTEIGITATEDDITLKKQFMDCIGLKKLGEFFDGEHIIRDYNKTRSQGGEGEEYQNILYDKDDMIFGEYSDYYELPEAQIQQYFEIINLLFPMTYLHAQFWSDTTVTISYLVDQYLFDPYEKTLTKYACGGDNDDYSRVRPPMIPDYCVGYYSIYNEETEEWEEYSQDEFEELKRQRKSDLHCEFFLEGRYNTIIPIC